MTETRTKRRLAAIMFADIVGYSAIMQRDESHAIKIRAKHRAVFEELHTSYHGEIIQYFGDGVLSIFDSIVEAVECAAEIQRQLQIGETKVPLRIGLHFGDIIYSGTEIYGDGVNVAARIEQISKPGRVFLSGKLNEELRNQNHISTELVGQFQLKNIDRPISIYSVVNDHAPSLPVEAIDLRQIPEKSIAVLPFANFSSNPEDDYFCDGMTEEIINALSKINGLRVTSRTSSFFYKNKSIPIPIIGAELNVNTVLEGSIRMAGNQMRLTAQLIDVAEDDHFFSETFDRPIEDVFAVQDEISLLIADRLREHLGHMEIQDNLVASSDVPLEAYKTYLKARFHILKMHQSDIESGIDLLNQVIEQQPDYAYAHLGLHLAYTLLGTIGFISAEKAFEIGSTHLQKAIEIDENLPECQLQLAYMAWLQKWDFKLAYEHLNRSREMRQTVDFYQSMASMLFAEAKFDAAFHYIDTAVQLDPLSHITYHLKGCIYYSQEKYSEAIPCFERSSSLNPAFMASSTYLGQSLLLSGRHIEGLEHFRQLSADDQDLAKIAGVTLAHIMLNHVEQAEAGIKQIQSRLDSADAERAMTSLSYCLCQIGRHEEALAIIERACEMRLPFSVYYFVEPLLKPLRTYDRYNEMKKKVIGQTDITPYEQTPGQRFFTEQEVVHKKKELQRFMENRKSYLDQNLTLRKLADHIDLPANHLSQLLNQGFKQNFSEFVNSYRLEAFTKRIIKPENQHLTILAIAFDCGFNSKTTFNTYFKKAMGMTPSAWWKTQQTK